MATWPVRNRSDISLKSLNYSPFIVLKIDTNIMQFLTEFVWRKISSYYEWNRFEYRFAWLVWFLIHILHHQTIQTISVMTFWPKNCYFYQLPSNFTRWPSHVNHFELKVKKGQRHWRKCLVASVLVPWILSWNLTKVSFLFHASGINKQSTYLW